MKEGNTDRGRSRSSEPATSAVFDFKSRDTKHQFNLKDLHDSSGSLSRCNPTGGGNVSASSHCSESPENASRPTAQHTKYPSRRRRTTDDAKRRKDPPSHSQSTKRKPIIHLSGDGYAVRVRQGGHLRKADGYTRFETTYTDDKGRIETYWKWARGEPKQVWLQSGGRIFGRARSIGSNSRENGRRRMHGHRPRSGATGRHHTRTSKSENPSSDHTRHESQRYAGRSRRPSVRHAPASTRHRSFGHSSRSPDDERVSPRHRSSRSTHPRSKAPVPNSLWESLPHNTKRDTPHTRQATHRRSTRQPSGRSDPVGCTLCSVM
jgi:hypothetical protein